MSRRVRLLDLASALSIDVSTVSRILNGRYAPGRFSQQTIAKVEAMAKTMGYRPSQAGRQLKTGKSGLVGLLLPDLGHPFFSRWLAAVESECASRQLTCLPLSIPKTPGGVQDACDRFVDLNVEGILFSGAQPNLLSDLPMIAIDQVPQTWAGSYVQLDEAWAAQGLAQALREAQCQRVFVLGKERNRGPHFPSRQSLLKSQLPDLVFTSLAQGPQAWDHGDVLSPIVEAMESCPPASVFVSFHSLATQSLILAAQKGNFQIPQDFGLIVFDGGLLSQVHHPPLYSLEQPVEVMAQKAMDLLLNSRDQGVMHHLEKGIWVEGQSLLT